MSGGRAAVGDVPAPGVVVAQAHTPAMGPCPERGLVNAVPVRPVRRRTDDSSEDDPAILLLRRRYANAHVDDHRRQPHSTFKADKADDHAEPVVDIQVFELQEALLEVPVLPDEPRLLTEPMAPMPIPMIADDLSEGPNMVTV